MPPPETCCKRDPYQVTPIKQQSTIVASSQRMAVTALFVVSPESSRWAPYPMDSRSRYRGADEWMGHGSAGTSKASRRQGSFVQDRGPFVFRPVSIGTHVESALRSAILLGMGYVLHRGHRVEEERQLRITSWPLEPTGFHCEASLSTAIVLTLSSAPSIGGCQKHSVRRVWSRE